MQTFLPYADSRRSAKCLDYKRLGKQRVEASQIYKIVSGERTTGGWINHPAVIMWGGYKDALAVYHNEMIDEWISRGYNNTMAHLPVWKVEVPWWWGDKALHASHRSNLLRKDSDFYGQYDWIEPDNLEYVWHKGARKNNGKAKLEAV